MQPFETSAVLDSLTEPYPSPNVLLVAAKRGDGEARRAISRLWLSEGIPYAFKGRPALYEALRIWLARHLDVQAKEITIIGSGRQGFSLSLNKDVGRPFGPHSDLDMTVVSLCLFQRLELASRRWEHDYAHGTVQPRHDREKSYWDDNQRSAPRARERGFIDPHKIPTQDRYPEAKVVMNALWCVQEKLKATPNAPNVRKVSLRVYRDWDSFVKQMAINLAAVGRSYGGPGGR